MPTPLNSSAAASVLFVAGRFLYAVDVAGAENALVDRRIAHVRHVARALDGDVQRFGSAHPDVTGAVDADVGLLGGEFETSLGSLSPNS